MTLAVLKLGYMLERPSSREIEEVRIWRYFSKEK